MTCDVKRFGFMSCKHPMHFFYFIFFINLGLYEVLDPYLNCMNMLRKVYIQNDNGLSFLLCVCMGEGDVFQNAHTYIVSTL